jgi:hypothetical protein
VIAIRTSPPRPFSIRAVRQAFCEHGQNISRTLGSCLDRLIDGYGSPATARIKYASVVEMVQGTLYGRTENRNQQHAKLWWLHPSRNRSRSGCSLVGEGCRNLSLSCFFAHSFAHESQKQQWSQTGHASGTVWRRKSRTQCPLPSAHPPLAHAALAKSLPTRHFAL